MISRFTLNFSMAKILNISLLIIILFLCACNKNVHTAPDIITNYFNPEMIGHWSNDTGCNIDFAKDGSHYLVTSFSDTKGHHLSNLILNSSKKSIMTEFMAQDKSIKFSGSFAEGMLVINDYCDEALHKVGY